MTHELEIMLKSYDYLRQEIENAITRQHQILTATAIIISVLLGLGLTLGLSIEETIKVSVIAIPPAVTALTAFWLIEQTRMMRAGDFLQLLEDEINIKAGGAYILWENWLRGGMAGGIHRLHHWSQYLGVFGVFYLVSIFSIVKTITDGLLPVVVSVIYITMLGFMLVLVFFAIQHRLRRRDEFAGWKEKEYWQKRLKQPPQQQ